MKDLTTYALSYAAVLAAAIAIMGAFASTAGPAQAGPSEPQVVVAENGPTYVAATMNIPF